MLHLLTACAKHLNQGPGSTTKHRGLSVSISSSESSLQMEQVNALKWRKVISTMPAFIRFLMHSNPLREDSLCDLHAPASCQRVLERFRDGDIFLTHFVLRMNLFVTTPLRLDQHRQTNGLYCQWESFRPFVFHSSWQGPSSFPGELYQTLIDSLSSARIILLVCPLTIVCGKSSCAVPMPWPMPTSLLC